MKLARTTLTLGLALAAASALTLSAAAEETKLYSEAKYDGFLEGLDGTAMSVVNHGPSGYAIHAGDTLIGRKDEPKKEVGTAGVFSFDTASLPDDARIRSAELVVFLGGAQGTGKMKSLGNLILEVASPHFGAKPQLEAEDLGAEPTLTAVQTLDLEKLVAVKKNTMTTITLDDALVGALSTKARTQLRIRFEKETNTDGVHSRIGFYSGSASEAQYRPCLVVNHD